MTAQEEITDSPTDWVNKHIQQYLSTDGRQGHRFYGHDALLITTVGRRSGKHLNLLEQGNSRDIPVIILERTDD